MLGAPDGAPNTEMAPVVVPAAVSGTGATPCPDSALDTTADVDPLVATPVAASAGPTVPVGIMVLQGSPEGQKVPEGERVFEGARVPVGQRVPDEAFPDGRAVSEGGRVVISSQFVGYMVLAWYVPVRGVAVAAVPL